MRADLADYLQTNPCHGLCCSPSLINNRRSLELLPPASQVRQSVFKRDNREKTDKMTNPSPPGHRGTSTGKIQRLPLRACLSGGPLLGTFPQLAPCTHTSHYTCRPGRGVRSQRGGTQGGLKTFSASETRTLVSIFLVFRTSRNSGVAHSANTRQYLTVLAESSALHKATN